MARAFALEDGKLSSPQIRSTRRKTYTDIDLMFSPRPSGDIYKKTDAAAIKQSVKNILMTNFLEKPFNTTFGGDLNSFLFDIDTNIELEVLRDRIFETVALYEPRASVQLVDINLLPENNTITVRVTFQVLNSIEPVVLDLSLARAR